MNILSSIKGPLFKTIWNDLFPKHKVIVRLAGLSGAVAIGLEIYRANEEPSDNSWIGRFRRLLLPAGSGPRFQQRTASDVFDTANKYHLIHTVALLYLHGAKIPAYTSGLMLTGQLVFCGCCYFQAFKGNPSESEVKFIGHVILLCVWGSLIL